MRRFEGSRLRFCVATDRTPRAIWPIRNTTRACLKLEGETGFANSGAIAAEQHLGRVTLIERQRDHCESKAVSDARIPGRPIRRSPSSPPLTTHRARLRIRPGLLPEWYNEVVQRPALPTKQHPSRRSELPANRRFLRRVSEGTRTPDRLDHNQELYQLSYAHRETDESTSAVTSASPSSLAGAMLHLSGRVRIGAARSRYPFV